MALTDKQRRFVEDRFYAEKLGALRDLARHLGMTERLSSSLRHQISPEAYTEYVVLAMIGLVLPGQQWWQRAACGQILDYLLPEWRANAVPEVLGPILDRNAPEVRAWRQAVLDRDGHACVHCGATERLQAHHILRWSDEPAARIIVGNGITLCEACHIAEHHGSSDGKQDN
ncbi:MAG TPA: HNH endonuclease [Microvirga sp.]|jgi:hypothetical protein|nr:HNH endonuclease [Microvirga sp.]